MNRKFLIILTVAFLPVISAATNLFPFDTLNVPDELLSDVPGDVYFSAGLYYLDGPGDPFSSDPETQSKWYSFIPLNVGCRFWHDFTAGAQITLLNHEYGNAVLDDYGDVWLKAKYSNRVNRFFLGGRIAGKSGGFESLSFHNDENAYNLDLTLFGGVELTERFSAEFAAGYRFVGTNEDTYDDLGNMLYVSGGPIAKLFGDVLTVGIPVTYYKQPTFQEVMDDQANIFYHEFKHHTVSVGPKAVYTFGDRFPSSVTFRADFVIAAENVERDYYVGGGYSVVAPF
ncbi:MAG: transporter [Candidatus Coatesbacteria bacterium]|nr:MAG: transporter [Candidatus Coatesbacteria bacterium]